MRNSKGVPSQLGLPAKPLGTNARVPDWAASLSVPGTESAEQTSWKLTA
jgi:hypothetical protein